MLPDFMQTTRDYTTVNRLHINLPWLLHPSASKNHGSWSRPTDIRARVIPLPNNECTDREQSDIHFHQLPRHLPPTNSLPKGVSSTWRSNAARKSCRDIGTKLAWECISRYRADLKSFGESTPSCELQAASVCFQSQRLKSANVRVRQLDSPQEGTLFARQLIGLEI
jgi:hypothetical protein